MSGSTITSSYNRVEIIQGAIESELAQDYKDIEYIVVDGASADGSVEIIKKMMDDSRWKSSWKFISEPDHGMYEAINKGIRMATGDIIGLVHSDDFLYDSHVISDVVRKFEETGAEFVYGDGVYVNYQNTQKPVRNWIGGPYYRWKVRCGWLPLHPTCYIRRDVMMSEGLYDETFKIAADTDLLVRYLYKAHLKVVYMRRRIIRMRMGGLSTDSEKRRQMWNEDVRLYSAHGFRPVILTKLMKMAWKVPQFIEAKFIKA
jgi:glycosyltransferase